MNPIIVLPETEDFCVGDTYTVLGLNVDDADSIKWEQPTAPPGGSLGLSSNTAASITLTPNTPGEYVLKLCKTVTEGDVSSGVQGPFIDCPYGAAINEIVTVSIVECSDIASSVWTVDPAATVISQGTLSVTFQAPATEGTIAISVECQREDGSTETLDCEIAVYDASQNGVFQTTSQIVCATVEQCGTFCQCTEVTIIVVDCVDNCINDTFYESPKDLDKTPLPVTVAPELMTAPLFGTKQVFDPSKYEFDDECCDSRPRLIEPHRPNFAWNDVCNLWTIAGDAAASCDCNTADFWQFEGSGTWSGSGQTCPIDMIIIKDHNMIGGQIISNPPIFADGEPVYNISACQDKAKIGGFIRPLVLPLNGLFEVGNATINFQNIVTADGGPAQIGKIFVGQKFFLEGTENGDDLLPLDFLNPLDGTGCDFKIKQNSKCRTISRDMEPVMVNWEFTFCASEYWLQCDWKSLMRYVCEGNDGLFFPSRNNRPDEVICFELSGPQDPPTFLTCDLLQQTLKAKSFVHYPALETAA